MHRLMNECVYCVGYCSKMKPHQVHVGLFYFSIHIFTYRYTDSMANLIAFYFGAPTNGDGGKKGNEFYFFSLPGTFLCYPIVRWLAQ